MTFWLNTADWFAPAALHAALAPPRRRRAGAGASGGAGAGATVAPMQNGERLRRPRVRGVALAFCQRGHGVTPWASFHPARWCRMLFGASQPPVVMENTTLIKNPG